MAEDLADYFDSYGIRTRYMHSDIDALERVDILRDLRLGVFDVLIGVNLLREGLDLPEVSLVAIIDADKEGFLRNERRSEERRVGKESRNTRSMRDSTKKAGQTLKTSKQHARRRVRSQ